MARQFSAASSQYMSLADNADISLGADVAFTWHIKAYLDSKAAFRPIIVKTSEPLSSANQAEFYLAFDNSADRFQCFIANGASNVSLNANNLGSPSLNTWYDICYWHDPNANTLNIQVDGGTADSVSWSSGTQDTAGSLLISNQTNTLFWSGRLAEAALWKSVLDAGERNSLAKSFSPQLIRPSSLAEYWPLIGRTSPEIGLRRGYGLTLFNTPTAADHPRMFYPARIK